MSDSLDTPEELELPNDESTTLSFQDIFLTQHDHFQLENGETIDFKSSSELDVEDHARVLSYQKLLETAMSRLSKSPNDTQAKTTLDSLTKKFIRMILPDLPDEILDRMVLGQKLKVMNFWMERNKTESKN